MDLVEFGVFLQFFGTSESCTPTRENSVHKTYNDHVLSIDPMFPKIQLKEAPTILRSTEAQKDDELVEITITKLLVRSYYNIVRKNI